jgi:hypothetical protein
MVSVSVRLSYVHVRFTEPERCGREAAVIAGIFVQMRLHSGFQIHYRLSNRRGRRRERQNF